MNKPNRSPRAKFRTIDQIHDDCGLARASIMRIGRESGALLQIGRTYRIDAEKFSDFLRKEYAVD